ncbi:unnamed protein product [Amoebophrya sp. A120]|nr:unnamed protein product [Amoebophrya sp. A120]|eukprot:GSA120T00020388001.1
MWTTRQREDKSSALGSFPGGVQPAAGGVSRSSSTSSSASYNYSSTSSSGNRSSSSSSTSSRAARTSPSSTSTCKNVMKTQPLPPSTSKSFHFSSSTTRKACLAALLTSEFSSLLLAPVSAQQQQDHEQVAATSEEKISTSEQLQASPSSSTASGDSASSSSSASLYKQKRANVRGNNNLQDKKMPEQGALGADDQANKNKLTDVDMEMLTEVHEYEEAKLAAEIDEKENQRMAEMARRRQKQRLATGSSTAGVEQKSAAAELEVVENEEDEKARFEHANNMQIDRRNGKTKTTAEDVAVGVATMDDHDLSASTAPSALLQKTKQVSAAPVASLDHLDPKPVEGKNNERQAAAAGNAIQTPTTEERDAAAAPADKDNQRPEVVKPELTKLSESVQARMKVVNAANSCLTHVCDVTFNGNDKFYYTLDVDIECSGDDCDVKCCSYVYCYVNVDKDVVVDYMLSGMSEKASQRTQLMFDACQDTRIVDDVSVPGYQSDTKKIESNRFMELQNFVSPHDCYHRTGFFHYPVIGTESKQYLRSLDTKDGVSAVKNQLPRAQPLNYNNDLKDGNLDPDVKKEIVEKATGSETSDDINFDFALRGSYTITSTNYAWEDPLLKVKDHKLIGDINLIPSGGNSPTSTTGVQGGVVADTDNRLRLIVSDSRGHNYPRLDAAYSENLSDWKIPYSREANVILGDSQKLGIPLKQCCSFVIQAYTGANFFNQYQEITERFISRNCVVFAANMHDIKCKNVWVWKNAWLSCLSGMTLKSVMQVTQELHFSVMQKRSLSCTIGNTWKLRNL